MSNEKDFSSFLRQLAPYVVVCGSFARGEETEASDIDCFLRSRPRQEIGPETVTDETYMPEVLDLIQRFGYNTSSVIVGHVAVERQEGVPRMVEVSSHYHINHKQPVFYREVSGARLMCAIDEKETFREECYDCAIWSEDAQDMVVPYPLPIYEVRREEESQMHTVGEIEAEYRRLDERFGIDTSMCPVTLMRKSTVKKVGCCHYNPVGHEIPVKKFSFSRLLFEQADDFFYDVIRHEYAHALVKFRHPTEQHMHDSCWKKACLEIGCSPTRVYKSPPALAETQIQSAKYLITCKSCGKTWRYYRAGRAVKGMKKAPNTYTCPVCKSHDFSVNTLR